MEVGRTERSEFSVRHKTPGGSPHKGGLHHFPGCLLDSNSRTTLDRVKWLMWLHQGWTFWLGSGVAPQPRRHETRIRCKDCGGALSVIMILNANGRVLMTRSIVTRVSDAGLLHHAQPFLDSG